MRTLLCSAAVLAMACLPGCGATIGARQDTAQALASQNNLARRDIAAPPFILASWQKITAPGEPVNIYIEGDGLAWLSRSEPSRNPTPKNPVALHLAMRDGAPNVVYVARPCQYTDLNAPGNHCDASYWMGKRFAPEVIESYMNALNQIAQASHNAPLHLIGYSGGANIAGLLAARRSDVLSLRTVAGNVDNDYFTKFHDVSAMPYSLNMANDAAALSTLPQYHFIGAEDRQVPAPIYQSYAAKMGAPSCAQVQVLENVSHGEGWEQRWPGLLALPVSCKE